MLKGTYKKLNNGTFGAWVKDDYTGVMLDALEPGTEVTLTTRRGENHVRIVAKEIQTYKSGHVVSLVADQAVAAKAQERYDAKKAEFAAENQDHGHYYSDDPDIREIAGLNTCINTHARCPDCGTYCGGTCDEFLRRVYTKAPTIMRDGVIVELASIPTVINSEGGHRSDDIEQLDR